MRFTLAMIVGCCCVSAQAATIDLDVPGAMRKLERSNPARHTRVIQLVSAVERGSCHSEDFARLQRAIVANSVECSIVVKMSDPPKQRVTFELDGTVYTTVVVLHRVSRPRFR